MKKIIKILLFLAGMLIVAFFYFGQSLDYKSLEINFNNLFFNVDDHKLHVYFLDVGQGDGILIKTPMKKIILVDSSPDAKILDHLGKLLPFGCWSIDYMILTHPHSDHLAGQVDVLKKYDVKQIYTTGVLHTTPEYFEWLKLIKDKKIKLNIVSQMQTQDIEKNIQIEFLYPQTDISFQSFENLNETSIVFKLTDNKISFLFTGDASKEIENELISLGKDLQSDVLKIAHHGSNDANSRDFLSLVQPKYAVISVGKNNQYSHPHQAVLDLLKDLGIKIFRTDIDGTVEMITDGEVLTVTEN